MPREVSAVIERIDTLGAGVLAIDLTLGESPPSFLPGQYLLVVDPDGAPIAFSIASPPSALRIWRCTTGRRRAAMTRNAWIDCFKSGRR